MSYFDTHAHYDWKEFDNDREKIFKNLQEYSSGVVNIGMGIESAKKIFNYAEQYKNLYCAIGIHPLDTSKNMSIEEFKKFVSENRNKIIAIGEIGLDYHSDIPKDVQMVYFKEQIQLANRLDLPVIIHARESHEDIIKVLKENQVKRVGIIHCYSGNMEQSKEYIELGFYIAFGGTLTRKEEIREVFKSLPIDKILLETDAPLLPPLPFEKSDRNETKYLKYIAEKMAELKGFSVEEIAEITTKNAYKLFYINSSI